MVHENTIVPQRFIPFDIGTDIGLDITGFFEAYFLKENYAVHEVSALLKNISQDILYNVVICEKLRLYIFRFGIGVFVLEDEPFPLYEKYSVDYCEYRRKAHKDILEFNYGPISDAIRGIICDLRSIVKSNAKRIRNSASEQWENSGLSYVMTVSYVMSETMCSRDYNEFDDMEKKNLHIMLQPSIAHKEDTMTLDAVGPNSGEFNPYRFDLGKLDIPSNWIKSEDCSIYISWAAVIVCLRKYGGKHRDIIECLEADLQAMWLYTYCQYTNLKACSAKQKMSSAELKSIKYYFQRKFNEFVSNNDSSIPVYINEIRNELIDTSGIKDEKEGFMEYIDFCIDETESHESERQRKYSVMNEVLLFIIAFIQVAPTLYSFMLGEYKGLELWPAIVLIGILLVSIIFIIKKE